MENSERSGSDMKLKVGELAERYGEAQRELTRLRDGAEERRLEIAALTEERDRHATALSVCEAARDELVRTLKLAEEHAPTQIAVHESRVQDLEAKLARRNEEFAEQLAQLRAEVDAAHSRLRAEEDSAGNLDNYKKRAQLALKKVSTRAVFYSIISLQSHLPPVSIVLAGKLCKRNADSRGAAAAGGVGRDFRAPGRCPRDQQRDNSELTAHDIDRGINKVNRSIFLVYLLW